MKPLAPNAARLRPIPPAIDAELLAIAEKAAGRRSDYTLHAIGWTRFEYVDAIHRRLRDKYRTMQRSESA